MDKCIIPKIGFPTVDAPHLSTDATERGGLARVEYQDLSLRAENRIPRQTQEGNEMLKFALRKIFSSIHKIATREIGEIEILHNCVHVCHFRIYFLCTCSLIKPLRSDPCIFSRGGAGIIHSAVRTWSRLRRVSVLDC